ncbi:MAG: hypothetical protein P4M14_06415 [Gammaproteobacteria bacterium]|nr:hypothetical protein [Gammaproteobacteria bacterium]
MKTLPEIILERERRAWRLRQQCFTQERIAEELNITQSAVSQILKRLCTRYAEENIYEIGQAKIEQIVQLEHIASEAMQAWEASKLIGGGNSRYLNVVMKAKDDIRKVLGIEAPIKAELNSMELEIKNFSDDELIAKAEEILMEVRQQRNAE